jgi:adenylate cyclase
MRSSVSEIAELGKAVALLNDTVGAFSSYMPRGLVQQLMDSGDSIKLGGQSRYLTMFFTDLEGFTTLSETTPVQQLLGRVSQYLEVFSHAVNQEGGTIDKFIGDAVMAFWGAPALSEDHAYRACVAAVRAQRKMATLNARWAAEGLPPLKVRIGIHSASVLVGNIGSAERMSYTVLGDGVNIAARLEGINKNYGTWICVSQNVYREAGERLWLRPMDLATVKGRREAIKIFELLGIRGEEPELEATPEQQLLCRMTEAAFDAYVSGDHETALTLYRDCCTHFPDDSLSQVMADRLTDALLESRLAAAE